MSQLPNPMPPEEERHVMVVSFGQQGEPSKQPPSRHSRSPSPELPPNFVPKPPHDASQFPAASTVVALMERMAGGNNIRDLIMIPATTWDRNNSHWELRLTQLKKQHKKDWAKREVELRRKYDEEFSDARYRQMLLEKEMKEIDFMKSASNETIFGKTWGEHKANKRRIQEDSKAALEAAEKQAIEDGALIKTLEQKLVEKDAAIEALKSALGGRPEPQVQTYQQGQQVMVNYPSQQGYQQMQSPGRSMALVLQPRYPGQGVDMQMQAYHLPPTGDQGYQGGNSQDPGGPHGSRRGSDREYNSSRPYDQGGNGGPNNRGHQYNPNAHQPKRDRRGGQRPIQETNKLGRSQDPRLSERFDVRTSQVKGEYSTNVGQHGDSIRSHQLIAAPPTLLSFDNGGSIQEIQHHSLQTPQPMVPVQVFKPPPAQSASWGKSFQTPPGGNVQTKPMVGPQVLPVRQSPEHREGSIIAVDERSLVRVPTVYRGKPIVPLAQSGSNRTPEGRGETPGAPQGDRAAGFMAVKVVSKHVGEVGPGSTGGGVYGRSSPGVSNRGFSLEQANPNGPGTKRLRSESPKTRRVAPRIEVDRDLSAQDSFIPLVDCTSDGPSEDDDEPMISRVRARSKGSPLFRPGNGLVGTSYKSMPPPSKPAMKAPPSSTMSKAGSGGTDGRGLGVTGSSGEVSRPRWVTINGSEMNRDEVEKLIDETDIAPLASDFTGRPAKKVNFKQEETPITGLPQISPKAPRPILEEHDSLQKKDIMLSNSKRFKRVLTINNIPGKFSKDNAPSIEYMLNKIRGGPLEYVKAFLDTSSLTFAFIHPSDAQNLWDFFNKDPDAKECNRRFNLQVAWDHEAIEPLSRSVIDLIIDDSAARMIKVFQCPSDKSNSELKESFCIDGPGDGYDEVISAKGKKEKTRRKHNGGLGIVAYVQCASIQYATKLLKAIKNGDCQGFIGAEVCYADDPCAFKEGHPLPLSSLRSW